MPGDSNLRIVRDRETQTDVEMFHIISKFEIATHGARKKGAETSGPRDKRSGGCISRQKRSGFDGFYKRGSVRQSGLT